MTPEYAVWRPQFAEALDPRIYDINYLDTLISTRRAQFWSTDHAAIVTEIKVYPKTMAIHGLIAAGDLREIVEVLIPRAEAWGKEMGCTFAMIESRPGWARALKDYEPHQLTVRKEL